MPLIRCPHCGEDTLTLAGWSDLDHCATCGRELVERRVAVGAATGAAERLAPAPDTSLARRRAERKADE